MGSGASQRVIGANVCGGIVKVQMLKLEVHLGIWGQESLGF